jgi:hypothetical protein
LSQFGVNDILLLRQLQVESPSREPAVVGRRKALIQALGELAAAKLLSNQMTAQVQADLLQRFREDPDPGVHGVCEWSKMVSDKNRGD